MVGNWSAVSQKNTHTYTQTRAHTHTHTHTHKRKGKRHLRNGRSRSWPSHLRAGWGARCFFGLGSVSVRGMAGLSLFLWPPQEAVGWEFSYRLSCVVWTGPKWAKHSYLMKSWKEDPVLRSLLQSSLGFLSLLSFLRLWQARQALGSFLVSHMVLITKDKIRIDMLPVFSLSFFSN